MANIKISELTALTPPDAADLVPVTDSSASQTKRTTVGEIVGIISGDVTVADDGTATISELPVSKLRDGAAGQIIQTDPTGTVVQWSTTANLPLGSALAPAYRFQGDSNTGIYSPGADQLALSTSGVGRVFVDASGNVGVGTTPGDRLHVMESSASAAVALTASVAQFERNGACAITISSTDTTTGSLFFGDTASAAVGRVQFDHSDNSLQFWSTLERARIDSSGRLLVGTSTHSGHACNVELAGSTGGIVNLRRTDSSIVSSNILGIINFIGDDPSAGNVGATISAAAEGTWDTDDYPTYLAFSTTADGASSPTERIRIDSVGHIYVAQNTTASPGAGNTVVGHVLRSNGYAFHSANDNTSLLINRSTSDGVVQSIRREGVQVGSISVTTTATAYNTSSDYRLKENILPVTDGITRLQQLKPSRFNFIADPDTTVDGFLAHEVQDIVPEAITGEKDAVDDEGNPQYQGIDQSKLVPLLTAALQEAIGRIETLEAEVAALKG